MQDNSTIVRHLLAEWGAGDEAALNQTIPLVYQELRRLAHSYLKRERSEHTLQSAALVHEAYLRLRKQENPRIENRAHLLAICARLMRQILVEYARNRNAAKRDGGERVTLTGLATQRAPLDVVVLDDALKELAKLDAQQSQIVEMKFFGGLSIDEISDVLRLSPTTVKRHWSTARLWLHHQVSKAEAS